MVIYKNQSIIFIRCYLLVKIESIDGSFLLLRDIMAFGFFEHLFKHGGCVFEPSQVNVDGSN